MPSYSSTPISRTINAPLLTVSGVGTRLKIQINSNDASIDAGITGGSVIRWDAFNTSYQPSYNYTPVDAEVLGVVETVTRDLSGNIATLDVVIQGSLKYPPELLAAIQASGSQGGGFDGGYDVLFLDSAGNPGGLTGVAPTSGIAKVVAQVAPHGDYNCVVVNYVGYQVGTGASVRVGGSLVGSVGTVADRSQLDETMIDASSDQILSIETYSELYDVIGDQGKYWEKITLTPASIIPVTWDSLVNQTAFQLVNGIKTGNAIIRQVDESTLSIWVEKQEAQTLYDSTKSLYFTRDGGLNILTYIDSTQKSHFTLPAVQVPQITIGSNSVIPYVVAKPSAKVFIPEALEVKSLTVKSDELIVDDRNVLSELDALKTLVNQINQFYNL